MKFLLLAIYCLILVQLQGGKRKTKNTVGESSAPLLRQKEKRGSAKSDVSKVLFPDIGKITNRTTPFPSGPPSVVRLCY